MLLTRLGANSRLVITGDLDQHDRHFEMNGLEDFLQRFKGKRSSSISSFEFEKKWHSTWGSSKGSLGYLWWRNCSRLFFFERRKWRTSCIRTGGFLLKNDVNNPATMNTPTDIKSLEKTKWNKLPTAKMKIKYKINRLCNTSFDIFEILPDLFTIEENTFFAMIQEIRFYIIHREKIWSKNWNL